MEKIKNHNNSIEAKYLDHELHKFKNEISMTRSRLLVVRDDLEHNSLTYKPLDNTNLISSFSHGHECVEDFFRESENATLMEKRIFENFTDPTEEVAVSMNMVDEDIASINYLLDSDDITNFDERYVRFGELVDVNNYDELETTNSGKCSDSQPENLIADKRIEPVSEVKLVPKEQAHTELQLIGKTMQHTVEMVATKCDAKQLPNETLPTSCAEKEQINQNPFIIKRLDVTNQPKSVTNQPNMDIEFQIPPEQNAIVTDLLTNDVHSDTMRQNILQKFFLRWIHYTTIEKLAKDNVSCNQSRIQKIEAFLNNIRLEKKKQIRNEKRIVDLKKKVAEPENPVVLARKYHHK